MRAHVPLFAVAILALVLAGCGSSSTTVVVTKTETQPPAATQANTQPQSQTNPVAEPTAALTSFQTPSGNIGCQIDVKFVRCDIRQRDWPQPPRPAGCPSDSDFGQGVEVTEGRSSQVVCAGDTALDASAAVLGYGTSKRLGSILCKSETAGVTCKADSGSGFFISKQSYRLF